jgi:hypothetical protein
MSPLQIALALIDGKHWVPADEAAVAAVRAELAKRRYTLEYDLANWCYRARRIA